MGFMLRWLFMLCLFYVSVEAHAYGVRPVAKPQAARQPSYAAKRPGPGTYSYVRPAAGGATLPSRPAAKYAASSATKYATPSAIPATTISSSSYESGYVTTESAFYTPSAATTSGYYAEPIYYSTEPTYYTTTPHSYYAEPIYYSTQPSIYNEAADSSYDTRAQHYTYVDPGTYFGEEAPAESFYTAPADYTAAVDYGTAAPVDYAPSDYSAGVVDYGTAAPANYAPAGDYIVDAGYNPTAAPVDAYVDPSTYYTMATGSEHYGDYNTESVPVYNGEQSYDAGSDVVYGTDVPIYSNNDYTTAVPVYYSQ